MIESVKKIKVDGRLFFTTDIHGEIYTMIHGLKELGFVEGVDTLVCAGDLIDRGRYNEETVQHFMEDKTNSYHTVIGNHDAFAFRCDSERAAENWIYNGGLWAFEVDEDHYETEASKNKRHAIGALLKTLPYAIEVEHDNKVYGVVHAAVPQEFGHWDDFVKCLESGNQAIRHHCVWDRDYVYYPNDPTHLVPLEGVDLLIHGHCVVKDPLLVGNRLHIDTGLVYGKKLTIVEMVDGQPEIHSFGIKVK